MSHHLNSPLARQDIQLDITDLYLFRGEIGTVFVINVCHSIAGPAPVPGYHPEGMYEFKVDSDGDAVEDVTYRITFDAYERGNQAYVLRCLRGADAADPGAAGTVVARGMTEEMITTSEGLRIWAGQAGDPFWIEPEVLHAVGHAFQDGTPVNLAGWDPNQARNFSPAIRSIPLCWRCQTPRCSPTRPAAAASASGPLPRSPPTRADGVRSIGLACQ